MKRFTCTHLVGPGDRDSLIHESQVEAIDPRAAALEYVTTWRRYADQMGDWHSVLVRDSEGGSWTFGVELQYVAVVSP